MNNNSISKVEMVQEFIDSVIKYFMINHKMTIDTCSITVALIDIDIDMEGPVCSDHQLMQIFKDADYLHMYKDDSLLYEKVYNVCLDYVKKVNMLLVNKNIKRLKKVENYLLNPCNNISYPQPYVLI